MNKIQFAILALFLVLSFSLDAKIKHVNDQKNNSFPQEEIVLSTNYSTILSGETLFMKLWIKEKQSGKPSKLSKIAYVEVLNPEKKVVAKQKIAIQNSTGNMRLFISEKLISGNYKIIAYTHSMLYQQEIEMSIKDLIIINPFKELPPNVRVKDSIDLKFKPSPIANNDLEIKLPRNTYQKRDKISFEIINPKNIILENALVSVHKVDSLNDLIKNSETSHKLSLNKTSTIVPEIRGEVISGKINPKKEKFRGNLANNYIILSIPGNNYKIYTAKTNAKGEFNFTIPEIGYQEKIYLQVFGDDRDLFDFSIQIPQVNYESLVFKDSISIPRAYLKYIESRSIGLQVENAYFEQKKDSLLLEEKRNSFYHPAEKTYILDDYTRFPSVEETIIEIVSEMFVSKRKGDYDIVLRDYKNNFNKEIYDKTLVLVDGFPIQEVETFLDYNPKNIERIELVNRGYVIGSKIFNGVVNFITKTGDYYKQVNPEYIFNQQFNRVIAPIKINNPNYEKENLARIPDYRNQLLWIENLEIKDHKKQIDFYSSDVPGKYSILIKGFTENGEEIISESFFTIE